MSGLQPDGVHHGHNQQVRGSLDENTSQALWDQRYQSSSTRWSGQANPQLVSEVSDLAPGSALDIGCGGGAQMPSGWPRRAGGSPQLTSQPSRWDAAQHMPLTSAPRLRSASPGCTRTLPSGSPQRRPTTWCRHSSCTSPRTSARCFTVGLADSVGPGGTLLVVGHDPSDLQTTVPRPSVPGLLFTASEVAASVPAGQWVTRVEEARARQTLDPDGHTTTIHDAVLRAQRIS